MALSVNTKPKVVEAVDRPLLKWAGGKRWLLPRLERIWRNHSDKRYVEPFCGGMAIALGLRPQRALVNDVNGHLINFYRHVGRGLRLEINAKHNERIYYTNRDRFNELIRSRDRNSAEAAQLFYYLNRTCFNGLCRFNADGRFNVPFGMYAQVQYAPDFFSYRKVFRNWSLRSQDFAKLRLAHDDFLYCDPPYDKTEFSHYSPGGFTWADQVRLIEWLEAHDGPVVISNRATARIIKLYRKFDYRLLFLAGPRRISANGNRSSVRELVAVKNL